MLWAVSSVGGTFWAVSRVGIESWRYSFGGSVKTKLWRYFLGDIATRRYFLEVGVFSFFGGNILALGGNTKNMAVNRHITGTVHQGGNFTAGKLPRTTLNYFVRLTANFFLSFKH